MALFRTVRGEQVQLSDEEELELRAEWEAAAAKLTSSALVSKKTNLIAMEEARETAALINTAMIPKRAQVESMSEVALDAAIAAGGLS